MKDLRTLQHIMHPEHHHNLDYLVYIITSTLAHSRHSSHGTDTCTSQLVKGYIEVRIIQRQHIAFIYFSTRIMTSPIYDTHMR